MSSPKFWVGQNVWFWRATAFFSTYCLLKHKMTRYSKHLEGPWPPGYAYVRAVCITYMWCEYFMQTLTYLYNIGSIFLYKILFIRRFIYSEINTFGLPKCSKIIFAFNIFAPIPVLEMVYLKTIQKIIPMDVSVSGTIDQKTYLKKFRGGFSPLSPPLNPPMEGGARCNLHKKNVQ